MVDCKRLTNFHNGTECKAYELFGCHRTNGNSFVFRVWAPHAKAVELVLINAQAKEFSFEMEKLFDGECFEVEVAANVGDAYCFRINTYDGRSLIKSDPYAFRTEIKNTIYSIVGDLPESLNVKNNKTVDYREPLNIYEVNLLSWKRHKDNSYYSYKELEYELVPYVKKMGYTHVEFMPVTEFPFDGSWGYQVTGYYSITSRLGEAEDFKGLIDAFHINGIKVLVDWVPAHFPKDEWGLYEFDGEPLYECPLWDRMEHSGWGTRKFDFGRTEVESFLISSAVYLLDKFGIDGLRVDAVASMLYLDYDKPTGDFTPNALGDSRNLEAIAFIKKLNAYIKRQFPNAVMIAEESTAFSGVTKSIEDDGLGFDYKWNMGWMNDVLFYCRQDPYFRSYHHNKMTFSMVYAFSEKYILPLSHDEVVHVKGSIVNKMPGCYEDKFAGERVLLGFMFAHPGKKLNFMGYEIAQFSEWNYNGAIELGLKKFELHKKMQRYVKDLNLFYLNNPPLYEIDYGWEGFKWLVVDDKINNLFAFSRYSINRQCLVAIFNFSGIDLFNYKIPLDVGRYRIVFNSDSAAYGGEGKIKKRIFNAKKFSSDGKEYGILVDIPKLTCIYLIKEN